jgi:ABC-type uncharacterized transport system involved in gliding motility auxiliary subunit
MQLNTEKFHKWLLFLGLLLLAAGLIYYSVVNVWNWKNLVVTGLGLIVTVYAVVKLDIRTMLQSRRFIYGGNTALVTLLVIASLGLIDFFLARHTWRVDTTSGGIFSLSPQTKKVLKELKKEVQIYAFAKDISKSGIVDQLKEYRHYSRRLNYEIIDPDEKPTLARQYKIKDYGNLVVLCEGKEELVNSYSEQALTNAIIKVTREGQKRVAFITGHGEGNINSSEREGFDRAKKAIEEQNYLVEELILADKDSIPSDYAAVILAGPKRDLFDKEKKLLASYLDNGGGLLVMVDPRPSIGLSDFLKQYYIEVGDNLIIDVSGFGRIFGASPDIPLVSNYTSHDIVKDLQGHMTFFPQARSIKGMDTGDNYKVTLEELARTGAQSLAVRNIEEVYRTGRVALDKAEQRGPLAVAVAMTQETDNANRKMRLVVVGDSDFASNAYFGVQANGDLFMNMVSWLLADEDLLSIRPKSPEMRLVNMTPGQTKTVFWLTVVVLPAIAFGVAILVYVRRR